MKIIFSDLPVPQAKGFPSKALLAMKLTVLLLLVACLQVNAHVDAQNITYTKNNISLEKVFKTIRKQTGYEFLYNTNMLKKAKKVDVKFDHTPLVKVLESVFDDLPFTYTIVGKTIVVKERESRSDRIAKALLREEVQGTVIDSATGEPLVGVTIKVEGSTVGTVTDAEGHFRLNVPDNAVLEISYLGYTGKEIPVKGRNNIKIFLSEATTGLNQLVVVGYGVQKKENLTGAVDQIEADDIALRSSGTINGTLQGLMPGLHIQVNNGDPNTDPDLNIRGFTSINGGGPLVLIDGIEGDLSDVNPIDIKSITVLKDAASAAIYGARGAFGVILVTTKKGKAGDITVNYTNNFAWTTPTTRTDFVSDPYVYAKTIDAAIFGYNGSSYSRFNSDMDWAAIKMVANGEIPPFRQKLPGGAYKFFYNTDWYDYLFRKWQPSQFHNISVSGGTEKIKAYLSGRVFDRATISNINDGGVKRYNLNANLSFKPVDWLELSANIKYTDKHYTEYGGYRHGFGGIWSTTTWYDHFPFFPNFVNGIPVDVGRSGNGGQGGPAAMEAGNNWRKYKDEKLTNTFRAKLTPLKGLEINMNYSNRATNQSRTYRYTPFEYLQTYELTKSTAGLNRLNQYRWKKTYKALNVFGAYSLRIHEDHNFKLMLGFNQESLHRDHVLAQSNGLLIRDLSSLGLATEMYNIDQTFLDWAVRGYFGRFNYNYKGKYLLEVDARYDGSSRFPNDNRWGFFPSVSAGWQVNREKFWKPIQKYVSSLKFRASYGKLGNQTVPVNTFLELMEVGQSDWLITNAEKLVYARTPDPLPSVVTWETTKTLDFGVDLGVLNNRILASFDWYERATEHMYLPGEPLPGVFGASEPRQNFGALRNRGFELSLTYHNTFQVAGAPLQLKATANVSNFKGVITKFNNKQGLMSSYWEGQKLGQIWGYHVAGQFQSDEEAAKYQASFNNPRVTLAKVYRFVMNVAQNTDWDHLRAGDIKYVDTDGDGRIDNGKYTLEDHGDLVPIGNAMPQFPFGFNISASYRGFDLSVAGAGVGYQNWYPTGDIYWGTYQRPYLSFIRKDLLTNAWTYDKPGKFPQIYRGYTSLNGGRGLYEMNDYYLLNVGFLRVKNMTIGYTLPKHLTQKLFIEKARVYLSGENLFTIRFDGDLTHYVDPEQAGSAIDYSSPGDAVARADLRDYPLGKTYSFGIQITL